LPGPSSWSDAILFTPDRQSLFKSHGQRPWFTLEIINGSVNCKDLLDCDISTPGGMQVAKEKDLFKTVCPKFIKASADILENMFEKR